MTKSRFAVKFLLLIICLLFVTPAFALETEPEEYTGPRIGNFNIAPKVGYAFYEKQRGDLGLAKRHSLLIQLDLDMGGAGSGFIFAPYYAMETIDTLAGKKKMHALGADFGMRYAFGSQNVFPYIGFQTKIGYIFKNSTLAIDHGLEIYGRIPLGLTYYVLEDLGIVVETCIGYGTTALTGPGYTLKFGHGLYTDVAVGIRWP